MREVAGKESKASNLNQFATQRMPTALGVMFFFKGVSDEGIVEAYRQVLDATADRPLRVVLYHIPQVSAVGCSRRSVCRKVRRWSASRSS